MGYLLKEALKTLCGVNQWSYAVFWRIGCQNPKLLIWEECYYEPPSPLRSSGIENPELGIEDWSSTEPNNSQLAVQGGRRVHFLVNKMMMDNHINVLGEGLVKRAAFTGNYQWILSQNYERGAHPPEVLKEVYQQFSAGMQTIAVIPVLPYGVVQLGSYLAIKENMAFVNDVNTLVLQLACAPGVFLSQNYATKGPSPVIEMPVYLGNSIAGTCSDRSVVMNSCPLISDSHDYKNSLTETATYVGQTSCPIGEVLDTVHSTAATFQTSNMSPSLLTMHAVMCPAKVGHSVNPSLPSTSQLTNGVVEAEVIPSNPEVCFNQQTSFYNPRSVFDRQLSICATAKARTGLSLMEQQISADLAVQSPMSNCNLSDSLMMSVLDTNTGLVSSSCQDFVNIPPANVHELYGVPKRNLESLSSLGSLSDAKLLSKHKSGAYPGGSEFQSASSSKSSVSVSKVVDNSPTNKLFTCSSVNGYNSADNLVDMDLADMNGRLENDLYQSLNVPLSDHNENTSLSECIPGLRHNERKHEYELLSPSAGDAVHEGACTQPCAGDDLFDILGLDFKNKLFDCHWNNSQNSELDSNITSLDKKNVASIKGSDADTASYLVKGGHSDSSIFSMMATDHLLDAVITSMKPSAKPILDDNVSCRTTLTNCSSSSLPNASQSSSYMHTSGQMWGELFSSPKSLRKPDLFGSCSFSSGPCKDNGGSYSQSSSLYGSQISSWIEQGHDVKPSTSALTAYSKKSHDVSKTNRKRLKPGENPRPRPKDRQMIQDRVKELREIVPNGVKCSIDGLLERTIKHMLFLQSVTKHADKLKQSGESKIIGKEGGLLIKDNYEGGATWAYEVGSQSMVCPIIVEDLNQPRQMLVEMLCEERGLFLEIADIIRGLGLTILKGIMETRNDKIWARFSVEANRDVTRMEIFMSLVHLLEQTEKNGVPPVHPVDEGTIVPQFPQATSIPASGRPWGLQ